MTLNIQTNWAKNVGHSQLIRTLSWSLEYLPLLALTSFFQNSWKLWGIFSGVTSWNTRRQNSCGSPAGNAIVFDAYHLYKFIFPSLIEYFDYCFSRNLQSEYSNAGEDDADDVDNGEGEAEEAKEAGLQSGALTILIWIDQLYVNFICRSLLKHSMNDNMRII